MYENIDDEDFVELYDQAVQDDARVLPVVTALVTSLNMQPDRAFVVARELEVAFDVFADALCDMVTQRSMRVVIPIEEAVKHADDILDVLRDPAMPGSVSTDVYEGLLQQYCQEVAKKLGG